jgi:hypothetical protein
VRERERERDHSDQLLLTFTERRLLHCSYNCRGTHITGSPAVYIDLIASAAELGVTLTTLKVAATGGNVCSQQTAKDMMEKLNIRRVNVSQQAIYMQDLAITWIDSA